MNADIINSWAAVLHALAWPIIAIIIVVLLRDLITALISKGSGVHLSFKDVITVIVEPAQGLRPPSAGTEDASKLTKDVQALPQTTQQTMPLDYYFLNHTSFLRKEKQKEFQERTGAPLPHYDIRVIVDSYYQGALDRIDCVEYVLHRAYPNPIQYRRNPEDKFLLKELANGEYVLMAKVFLKDRKEPVLLQRYITLWETGPQLP